MIAVDRKAVFENVNKNNKNMTLSFSQKFPDKSPTFFVEKIWRSILCSNLAEIDLYKSYLSSHTKKFSSSWIEKNSTISQNCTPKIHTIREDKKDRWKVGNKIHFAINNRTKNRFQFAPILKVKSIQKIEIKYLSITKEPIDLKPIIWIDGYLKYDPATGIDNGMLEFARNDGFDSIKHFFEYFSENFTGKIIHWTDLVY